MRTFLEQHKAAGAGPPRLIPVLRARVTGVRGRDVNLANVEDVRARGSLAREYTITYRDHLEPNEKIIDGKFWTGEPPTAEDARPAEVSVERSIHERFHIDVGDLVRFDVLGRVVEARVSSVRDVEWEDARNGGFMFVFRPGPFEHAPQTWIGILRAPEDPAARGRFQRDLVARFPNVSAIDVKEILTTIQQAVANVTLAITIVGAVALLSGVLILDRGRRDDQVSTGLRGGHPAYAGGQHQNDWDDARRRVRWLGPAGGGDWRGRGGWPQLGDLPSCAGHPVASSAWHCRDRGRRDDRTGRSRGRCSKLRRVAA